jgi:hypothetical protein
MDEARIRRVSDRLLDHLIDQIEGPTGPGIAVTVGGNVFLGQLVSPAKFAQDAATITEDTLDQAVEHVITDLRGPPEKVQARRDELKEAWDLRPAAEGISDDEDEWITLSGVQMWLSGRKAEISSMRIRRDSIDSWFVPSPNFGE